MKFVSVLFILLTLPVYAQEKGTYFRLGQMLMAFSGTSYSSIEDNIYANEVAATACKNKLNKISFQEAMKETDIKDCNEISKRVFLKPDNTGFKIADFFGVGCTGTYKKITSFFNQRLKKEETNSIEYKFESRFESRSLKFTNLEATGGSDNRIQIFLPDERRQEYITLNITYNRKPNPAHDHFAEWDFRYKVNEGTDKKLIVEYNLDSIPPRGLNSHEVKTKITINCISQTLEEMNAIAKMYED